MIRWSQRARGLKFAADCPDHVKLRALTNSYPKMFGDDRLVIPLCDHPFVSVVDTSTRGWLLPFVGFVSDMQVSSMLALVRQKIVSIGGGFLRLFQ